MQSILTKPALHLDFSLFHLLSHVPRTNGKCRSLVLSRSILALNSRSMTVKLIIQPPSRSTNCWNNCVRTSNWRAYSRNSLCRVCRWRIERAASNDRSSAGRKYTSRTRSPEAHRREYASANRSTAVEGEVPTSKASVVARGQKAAELPPIETSTALSTAEFPSVRTSSTCEVRTTAVRHCFQHDQRSTGIALPASSVDPVRIY